MAGVKVDTSKEQRHLFRAAKKKGVIFEATRKEILAGNARFMEADLLHRAEITTGAGIYNILLSNNDKDVGVSDLQGNMTDPGVNIAVGRVRIGYAKVNEFLEDGSTPNPEYATANAQNVIYDNALKDLPVELRPAKLKVQQDNKTLFSLPVERFTVGSVSSKVQGEEDVLALQTPIILAERKEIKIQLEFSPSKEMPDGAKHFFEVRFMGVQTASK
ncbi:hypothetical protein [Flammeovirga sp. OC4]|uniref:hypothetical protein n=1 Tax=Flammeovirga sp. OC4 TaxID=1382345 RepID=UPI0005C6929F|nr:hypothetical protein [Flammeovirga sp. OC4]